METNTFDFNDFKVRGENFLQSLTTELEAKGISTAYLECDHLCFRVETQEQYSEYKKSLSKHGDLLTEALVNGRAISTFKLFSPFQIAQHQVFLVELPSPKTGTSYLLGFEHAEFVVKESFDTFMSNFPHLDFSIGGNPTLNPELCLKLTNGHQAKFHHTSLERIIEIEEAQVQHIIFDFDGTLIKSRENIYEINRIVFSKALDREVSLQESIDNFHPEFSKLFQAYTVTCPIKQKEAIADWGLVAENFTYDLFEGALETLHWLSQKNVKLHLWTARDEYSARKILKEHNIEHLFSTLSFATNVDSKPHANSLRFDWANTGKDKMIVVGDSPSDIIGAKNISAIRGAALWDPYANKNSLVAAGAELFFHGMTDFRKWFSDSAEAR